MQQTLFANAIMQFPKLARDLLMAWVSFSLCPSDPDSFNLSDPARSTRFRVPVKLFSLN